MQIKKANSQKKAGLHEEMQCLVKEVNLDTDRLGDLIKRMADAGFVDPDTSSSEDMEEPTRSIDAASGGAVELCGVRSGTVTVCTGKACTRKGQSDSITQALQQHWAGSDVLVQTCSCMSMCKSAANVQIDSEGCTTTVTGLSPSLLTESDVPVMQLAE